MLVKVGEYRINLTHVLYVATDEAGDGTASVVFSEKIIELTQSESKEFLAAWDKWAAFQAGAQEINEYAIKENIAHIRAAQNKSGIVPVAAMPQLKRGRG